MKILRVLFFLVASLALQACHKKEAVLSSENKLLSFAVSKQIACNIDQDKHQVFVMVPYTVSRTTANVSLSVSSNAAVALNGITQPGGQFTADLSKASTMTITAQNGDAVTWSVYVMTDLEDWGLGTTVTADKTLNKTYNWYIDQYTSGTYWAVNCGPASVTMAIKWADSTFSKTAIDARNTYKTTGGWWYTTDIVKYLSINGINWIYTNLPDSYQTMEKYIDKGDILILCLDNYYLTFNPNLNQHVGKFYTVNQAGSGHFIVIKGYKQVDGKVLFEAYDPWSLGVMYSGTNNLKGMSRYYTSADLEQATNVWWDYAIVIAPKGKQVTTAAGVKTYSLPDAVPAQKGQ